MLRYGFIKHVSYLLSGSRQRFGGSNASIRHFRGRDWYHLAFMMEGEQVAFSHAFEQTRKSVMGELRISVGHERGNVRFGKLHNNV